MIKKKKNISEHIFICEKYILLQRGYGGTEYATICAYFYTSPTSRLHICINMQLGLQIWGIEVKKKAKTSLKKVKTFLKFFQIFLIIFQ